MRILLINSVCGVTSTGRICSDLAKAYLENGHEVTIAYGRVDKGMPEECAKYSKRIGMDFDVKLHGLQTRFFDRHGFGSRRATEQFLKWVDEYKPDVIHLHNLHGYYIHVELLFQYLKEKAIPVVWTLHDCWAMTGHCTHFNAFGCEKWKTQCTHCPLKQAYPSSKLFDRSEKNYLEKRSAFTSVKNMVIATPSAWLKSIVKQSFLQDYDVQVVNNGIDTAVFKPTLSELRKQYGLERKKIALGVANGWGPHKGLKYLQQMALDLPDEWKVVAVGLSDEQLTQLPDGMLGIKRTNSPQELAAWYTTADVFVNPTLEDTYPTTNLEAQACGTPVVSFDSDGAAETVAPGAGAVVPRMNYSRLVDRVIQEAAHKARFVIPPIKDKRGLSGDYERLYRSILADKERCS